MAEIIETVPFSFDEIYEEIKGQFAEAGYDTAEGSNTSQLITSLSYLVSMLNVNTSMNTNEMILKYANNRENILHDARNIGYEALSKTSYVYNLTLRFTAAGNYSIPKYTEFTCGDYSYYYLGSQIDLSNVEEGDTITIDVKEGTLTQYADDPDSLSVTITEITENGISQPLYYIDIPYTNVEDDGLEVYANYYDEYGIYHKNEEWTKSDYSMIDADATLSKEYIRQDNIEFKTPRIYFKFAGLGKGLSVGTLVNINVLQSHGADGGILSTSGVAITSATADKLAESVKCETLSNFEVDKVEIVTRGQNEETIASIKQNAPVLYNSANRLVTAFDYSAACNRDSRVKYSIIWGGEDEYPLAPGHIWFTFYPNIIHSYTANDDKTMWARNYITCDWDYSSDSDEQLIEAEEFFSSNYIAETDIRSNSYTNGVLTHYGIWDKLENLNIPTLVFHHRHPVYITFDYDIGILKYLVSDSKEAIHTEIFNLINNFFTGNDDTSQIENFNVEYFNSSLIKRIDNRISDISGFNLELTTKVMLTNRNICLENQSTDYKDIYVSLSVPYEKYFDDNNFLMYDVLPKIDTNYFIEYLGEASSRLFVDWSKIQEDIDHGITQRNAKMIIAPIKIYFYDTYRMEISPDVHKAVFKYPLYPDDFSQTEPESYTFNNTHIFIRHDGIASPKDVELVYNTDWFYDEENPNVITISDSIELKASDIIEIEMTQFCGFYYLFNTNKKEILIHLFVDGKHKGIEYAMSADIGDEPIFADDAYYLYTYDDTYLATNNEYYLTTEAELHQDTSYLENHTTIPRSYLNSNNQMYFNTSDNYYLTTNGYALPEESDVKPYTGPIVKEINTYMYLRSPIKYDLFSKIRYLNLNYPSDNFKVIKGSMPILKSVTFNNVIE